METNSSVNQSDSKEMDCRKFELEKTHSACFEAGRRLANAFSMLVVLYATLAIFTFSTSCVEKIKIPVFGLELSKWLAVDLVTILCASAFYRFAIAMVYEQLLSYKLRKLLKCLHDVEDFPWSVFYPSLHNFHNLSDEIEKWLGNTINAILVLIGVGLPLTSLLCSLVFNGLGISLGIAFVLSCVFLGTSFKIVNSSPDFDSVSNTFEKLEKYS